MNRDLFGVPAVLAASEKARLLRDLIELWHMSYGCPPEGLAEDLELCRRFYDPLTRGHKLRERLAQLPKAPPALAQRVRSYGEALVTDAGEGVFVVGVETRIMIGLLSEQYSDDDYVVIAPSDVAEAERRSLTVYREWATARLAQVIALRTGRGEEVLQAISVGLVFALLVNRSDGPERALYRRDKHAEHSWQLDQAIHAGAESFAKVISGQRKGRAEGEQRLKGGYALSEARRRLSHRIVVQPAEQAEGEIVYIPRKFRQEVLEFLGTDLARRASLSEQRLEDGLNQLVDSFRSVAGNLAHQSMVYERPADTRLLMQELLNAFKEARSSKA